MDAEFFLKNFVFFWIIGFSIWAGIYLYRLNFQVLTDAEKTKIKKKFLLLIIVFAVVGVTFTLLRYQLQTAKIKELENAVSGQVPVN